MNRAAPDAIVISRGRLLITGLLAWLMMLGVDVLLHAGILARLYVAEDDPFLLGAAAAFRRIPVGYAAFAVLTIMLI